MDDLLRQFLLNSSSSLKRRVTLYYTLQITEHVILPVVKWCLRNGKSAPKIVSVSYKMFTENC